MYHNLSLFSMLDFFSIDESNLVIILIISAIFFGVLLFFGIRKSYLLQKESERINSMSNRIAKDIDKSYKNFADGHIYSDNN